METVKIKIKNKTGKSIELTMDEAKEVYAVLAKLCSVPSVAPYIYPYTSPLPRWPYEFGPQCTATPESFNRYGAYTGGVSDTLI